jgi:hypothetical protein
VFTDEANTELEEFMNSKKNFIGLTGKNVRLVEGDSVHSLYCMTKILEADKSKLIKPVFK